MMLPGAPPDRETLPVRVLCWLLPLPALVARGQEVARVQAERQGTCPLVSQHMEPLGLSTKTLNYFCFVLFCFVLPFFQITIGRKLFEIPRVGLKGWSEDAGK